METANHSEDQIIIDKPLNFSTEIKACILADGKTK